MSAMGIIQDQGVVVHIPELHSKVPSDSPSECPDPSGTINALPSRPLLVFALFVTCHC